MQNKITILMRLPATRPQRRELANVAAIRYVVDKSVCGYNRFMLFGKFYEVNFGLIGEFVFRGFVGDRKKVASIDKACEGINERSHY